MLRPVEQFVTEFKEGLDELSKSNQRELKCQLEPEEDKLANSHTLQTLKLKLSISGAMNELRFFESKEKLTAFQWKYAHLMCFRMFNDCTALKKEEVKEAKNPEIRPSFRLEE